METMNKSGIKLLKRRQTELLTEEMIIFHFIYIPLVTYYSEFKLVLPYRLRKLNSIPLGIFLVLIFKICTPL